MQRRQLLGLLGSAGAAIITGSGSSVFGRSASRVPLVRDEFVAGKRILQVRWSRSLVPEIAFFSYKPQEFAVAASSDDGKLVYIGSSQKSFFALGKTTGAVVWERKLKSSISSHPLFLKAGVVGPEALVIVGDDSGAITALEAQSGQERWVYRARGPVQTQPVHAGAFLYATSNEGRVYALDVRTGAWRWSYDRETSDAFSVRGQSGVLPVGGKLYVGFPDGHLSCLNSENGEVIWNRSLAGDASRFTDVDGTPVLLGDLLITSCYASGLFALEAKDGSTRWRFEMEAAGPFRVDPSGERIYGVSATQGLFCIDKRGRKLWQQVMHEQGELSAPIVWGKYLLFTAAATGLHIADAETGALLQFFDPGQGASAAPVVGGSDVYLLSNAGVFFALSSS